MSAQTIGPAPAQAGHRRTWTAVAALLATGVFLEAVFAGAMLSGAAWARQAHRADALALVGASAVAGLAALVLLRRVGGGVRLALTLLAQAAILVAQAALGAAISHGANLLWLHIPLGVALVGLAMQAVAGARRLGG